MTIEITLESIKEKLEREITHMKDLGLNELSEEFYPSISAQEIQWLINKVEELEKENREWHTADSKAVENLRPLIKENEKLKKQVQEQADHINENYHIRKLQKENESLKAKCMEAAKEIRLWIDELKNGVE